MQEVKSGPVMEPPVPAGVVGRVCPNCGSAAVHRFCSECGEEQAGARDLRLSRFLRGAAHELFGVDGRLVVTLRTLFGKPGQLTLDYVAGRRQRYIPPLQLYLLVSLLFFVAAPRTFYYRYNLEQYMKSSIFGSLPERLVEQRLTRTGESLESFTQRFNARLNEQKRTMAVFFVPGLALALGLLYAGRKRFFVEHLVFSTHFFCAYMLYMLIVVPLFFLLLMQVVRPIVLRHREWIDPVNRYVFGETGLSVLLFVPSFLFLHAALRRMYGDRRVPAAVRAGILVFWLFAMVIVVFKEPLFFTTFFTI